MEATALQLSVAKDFDSPVSELYKAWNTEENLRNWWHPMGDNLVACVNELRPGGKLRYEFARHDGTPAFSIEGEYREVEEGRRLVYTWEWKVPSNAVKDTAFLLTVEFKERDGGSRLEVTQDHFSEEESLQPHREGWDKALNDLKAYLDRR